MMSPALHVFSIFCLLVVLLLGKQRSVRECHHSSLLKHANTPQSVADAVAQIVPLLHSRFALEKQQACVFKYSFANNHSQCVNREATCGAFPQ